MNTPTEDNAPKLLKANEVAKRLRIGVKTFYKLVQAGRFPRPFRLGPRSMRWRAEDVDRWLNEVAELLARSTSETTNRLITAQLDNASLNGAH